MSLILGDVETRSRTRVRVPLGLSVPVGVAALKGLGLNFASLQGFQHLTNPTLRDLATELLT